MAEIAFYAPMKPPDDTVPSGDRTMGRALLAALASTGLGDVTLISRLRSRDRHGDEAVQEAIEAAARAEIERLAGRKPPALWLTYHSYYKAPDLLGPVLSRHWGIPYALIEATRASSRLTGPYARFAKAAEEACDAADLIFYLTDYDREALERDRKAKQQLVWLKPFLNREALDPAPARSRHDMTRLLACAMFRPGDKLASYEALASALGQVRSEAWTLTIVGDGAARAEVEALFSRFGDRVTFLGALEQQQVNEQFRRSDALVWPGVGEAYGMVYLEAQAQGCPVLAEDRPGVRDVVDGGGWLTPANDVSAYARAIESIISDADGPAPCRTPGAREGCVRPPHRQRPRDFDRSARTADQGRVPLISARLALMRHGHTAWNRAGRIQGRVDQPLDEAARIHLMKLQLPEEFSDAKVISSPLARAVETAQLVAGREPSIVPELVEMDWGRWEGQRGVDLIADAGSGYRHIEEWGWDFQPPGGETPAAVWHRLQPWIRSLEGSSVVVSHIGIMRVLLARATGWEFDGHPPFQVKRDRLYRIDILDDGKLTFDNQPVRLGEKVARETRHHSRYPSAGNRPSQPRAHPGAGVAASRHAAAACLGRHADRPPRHFGYRLRAVAARPFRRRRLHPAARSRRATRKPGPHAGAHASHTRRPWPQSSRCPHHRTISVRPPHVARRIRGSARCDQATGRAAAHPLVGQGYPRAAFKRRQGRPDRGLACRLL